MENGLVVEVRVSLLSLNVALISCLFRFHGICAVSSSSLPRFLLLLSISTLCFVMPYSRRANEIAKYPSVLSFI